MKVCLAVVRHFAFIFPRLRCTWEVHLERLVLRNVMYPLRDIHLWGSGTGIRILLRFSVATAHDNQKEVNGNDSHFQSLRCCRITFAISDGCRKPPKGRRLISIKTNQVRIVKKAWMSVNGIKANRSAFLASRASHCYPAIIGEVLRKEFLDVVHVVRRDVLAIRHQ